MKRGVKALSTSRSALATVLMLWCAGTGCMIVSYAHGATLNSAEMTGTQVTKKKLRQAAAGNHTCCKAHHSPANMLAARSSSLLDPNGLIKAGTAETHGPASAESCCPLTSGSFVTASRSDASDDNSSTVQSKSFSVKSANSSKACQNPSMRLADQNQTYLRGCVFLI
jgi:hypothetical protein